MVRKLVTLIAVSSGLILAGCNTVRGVGEDIQSVPDCVEGKTC
jgi:predicted small secreted protein